MKILNRIQKFFLTILFLLLFTPKITFCDENLGGVLLYAYYESQAYLLVTLDSSNQENIWGGFSCNLCEEDNLFERISTCAFMGTSGVFAGINNILLDLTYSQDQQNVVRVGIDFFKGRLKKSETLVIKHNDMDCFLYFTQVKFIAAQVFADSFNTFQKTGNGKYKEYFKNSCFAWLNIKDLINIINQRNQMINQSEQWEIKPAYQIVFELHQPENGPRFFARAFDFKNQGSEVNIMLNSDLSTILGSKSVLEILNNIVKSSSSNGSKSLSSSSGSTD